MTSPERFILGIFLIAVAAWSIGFATLLVGKLIRPKNPGGLKDEIYECGEPTIGPAWVQFDLRFYVVAILFLVFDIEIAMLYPWAVVYRTLIQNGLGAVAFWEMFFFFSLLVIGFIYLWQQGFLDWVRTVSPEQSADSKHIKVG
ncbi:MAG: NADH-quinone oxidoreductase subunit A [Thermodesulfobacteriota bacterium]